jgi:hypothetical protein
MQKVLDYNNKCNVTDRGTAIWLQDMIVDLEESTMQHYCIDSCWM